MLRFFRQALDGALVSCHDTILYNGERDRFRAKAKTTAESTIDVCFSESRVYLYGAHGRRPLGEATRVVCGGSCPRAFVDLNVVCC